MGFLRSKLMKIVNRYGFVILSAVFSTLVFFSSCSKDDDYEYLVSYDLYDNYNTSEINFILDLATATYPEISAMKQYFSHSVDIYKVVYKTEVQNTGIYASGLVCVPADKGNYPLLSFQNGTNTLNSYSPSENPGNPVYLFVEMIASMGYVVVIPDYPGFGESASIPHPYLIKEPTVRSVVDMLFAVREMDTKGLPDQTIKDAVYLAGYSQGGWATLAVHEALENDYSGEFNLKGSVCGAGPYDLNILFNAMTSLITYPMPVYIGYIINAYSEFDQFANPVTDILKEKYASILANLYTGSLTSDEINDKLTNSISDLFTDDFLSGLWTDTKYSSVRASLTRNSVVGWKTLVPLFFVHGGGDTSVDPVTTESIYEDMIQAGTSTQTCTKEIIPYLDHGEAVVPAMIKGLQFIMSLE